MNTQARIGTYLLLCFSLPWSGSLAAEITRKIDFIRDVKPIFEAACIGCHGENEEERGGDFRMDSKKALFSGGDSYEGVVPGKPNESPVWWMTTLLPEEDGYDEVMPPDHQKPLNRQQQDVLEAWVVQGAEYPDDVVLTEGSRVDFVAAIAPLFYKGPPFDDRALAVIQLWTEQGAAWTKDVRFGNAIPKASEVTLETKPDFAKVIGPLILRGGPFNDPEVQVMRKWAAAGAKWGDGFKLTEGAFMKNPDNLELVEKIREHIVATTKVTKESEMKAYTDKLTKTDVEFEMVPIPGGEFLQGSPDSEPERLDNEGPQRKVRIAPFWMGKFEVTWDEYESFMTTEHARRKDGRRETWSANDPIVELISSPTTSYTEMSFGMGIRGYPPLA